MRSPLAFWMFLRIGICCAPGAAGSAALAAADSAGPAAAVEAFHRALATGDSAAAVELLAGDAMVLENGYLETRAEYLSHHLGADMAFASAVRGRHEVVAAVVEGAAAWVIARISADGEWDGRLVQSDGAELMVLRREADAWKIAAIHWSSHKRR